jgi:hypothetical protein
MDKGIKDRLGTFVINQSLKDLTRCIHQLKMSQDPLTDKQGQPWQVYHEIWQVSL